MSVGETRISCFNSIDGVLEALPIVTVVVVKEIHNEIDVTVQDQRERTGR